MKIGFARFEDGDPYATIAPAQNTLEAYAKDLAHNNPGKEFALDFFTETPSEDEHDAINAIMVLDALVKTSDNFRAGLEWLISRVYALGVARGKREVIEDWDARCGPLAQKLAEKLEAMGFHSQQPA